MYFGYNTNGLAHHALEDAIRLLADLGYRGVAITLEHCALNPFADSAQLAREITRTRDLLAAHNMRSVVETGARFLLDARRKHFPTLLAADANDRARRLDFLKAAIQIATDLGSDCVSFWSGAPDDDANDDQLWQRMIPELDRLVEFASSKDVTLAFEPEPGMFVDTMQRFAETLERISNPDALRLTLDVGHLHCLGEVPIAEQIERWSDRLVNIHIEDMRAGVHEHLMFGEGEIDFPPILRALKSCDYEGGVFVELSRHSHCGPMAAQQAHQFLTDCLEVT